MLSPPPLPRPYRRRLYRDMTGFLLALILGIEAIYLSDKVLTDLLFAMLDHGLGGSFLLRGIVLASPEILLLGLPLALVVTVFMVLLQRREAGDLLALAQAGLSPGTLARLGLMLGGLGFVVSLGIGGVLAPLANHELGRLRHEARFDVLESGQPGNRSVVRIEGATLVFHRRSEDEAAARLFLHVPDAAGETRIITARDSALHFESPGADGALFLSGAHISGFRSDTAARLERTLDANAAELVYRAPGLAIPAFAARGSRISALTLPELMTFPHPDDPAARKAVLRMVLSAVLALVAPPLALLAMGLTRGGLSLLAGPLAIGAILAGGFLVAPLAGALAGMSLRSGLFLAMAAGTVAALVLGAMIVGRGDSLFTPARFRL